MASFILVNSLPKFSYAGAAIARRSTYNPRLFLAASPRCIQASSQQEASAAAAAATEAVKEGTTHAQQSSQNIKDKAFSTAEQVTEKAKDIAGKVSATAQEVTEKAKQTVQEVLGSAKDTTKKGTDTFKAQAKASKQHVKANAEKVEKCMNTKDV